VRKWLATKHKCVTLYFLLRGAIVQARVWERAPSADDGCTGSLIASNYFDVITVTRTTTSHTECKN